MVAEEVSSSPVTGEIPLTHGLLRRGAALAGGVTAIRGGERPLLRQGQVPAAAKELVSESVLPDAYL
jgi:hypothetical protein